MLKPHFITTDLSGRVANLADTLFRGVPLVVGHDGVVSGYTLTTSASVSAVRVNVDVICLPGHGYAVVTGKDAGTLTLSTADFSGLTGARFCIGGVESFSREAYAVMQAHLLTGVQDRDGTVVARGFADVFGDAATDYVAAIPDGETIFNEPHKLLTLVYYFTSQFLPGGERYRDLANVFWQEYVRMFRNAVQVYAAKQQAAGVVSNYHDQRLIASVHTERV